jgi:hypothetical protein
MLRRGDPEFRLAVNRTLARLYRSGQVLDIYRRWFGQWGTEPVSQDVRGRGVARVASAPARAQDVTLVRPLRPDAGVES